MRNREENNNTCSWPCVAIVGMLLTYKLIIVWLKLHYGVDVYDEMLNAK